MRRTSSAVFIALLLLVSSCATPVTPASPQGQATEAPGETPVADRQWSEDEGREIAEQFLRSSPTFSSRGGGDSLKLLSTTPREEPSSWQFDFEFESEYPGYGRLGSEPTPPVRTSHQAQVVVQDGVVTRAVLDEEWDVLAVISQEAPITRDGPEPSGAETDMPEGNLVHVHFSQEHWYTALGDSFINRPISGKRVWRAHAPINESDETGAPVVRPWLTLDSGLDIRVEEDRLTRDGPPTYQWQLESITEASEADAWPWDAFVVPRSSAEVTPGYDVTRSFDRTVFWGEGTQTMTVTVTPRERVEELGRIVIMVHTNKDSLVADAVVLSYSGVSWGDVNIAEGGHRSGIHGIPLEVDTPVTVAVTLRVTPRVPWIFYKPDTGITTNRPGAGSQGTVTGPSVTITNEVGTWTWQAEGEYVWFWTSTGASADVSIGFGARSVPISILTLVGLVVVGVAVLVIRRRRKRKRAPATTPPPARAHTPSPLA